MIKSTTFNPTTTFGTLQPAFGGSTPTTTANSSAASNSAPNATSVGNPPAFAPAPGNPDPFGILAGYGVTADIGDASMFLGLQNLSNIDNSINEQMHDMQASQADINAQSQTVQNDDNAVAQDNQMLAWIANNTNSDGSFNAQALQNADPGTLQALYACLQKNPHGQDLLSLGTNGNVTVNTNSGLLNKNNLQNAVSDILNSDTQKQQSDKSVLDNMNSQNQVGSLRLQSLMEKRSDTLTTLTDIQKSLYDMNQAILSNLKI